MQIWLNILLTTMKRLTPSVTTVLLTWYSALIAWLPLLKMLLPMAVARHEYTHIPVTPALRLNVQFWGLPRSSGPIHLTILGSVSGVDSGSLWKAFPGSRFMLWLEGTGVVELSDTASVLELAIFA